MTGLLTALLAVQQEAPTLPKDATNPHFRSKYTPLDTIVEKIGPILNRHGLIWTTLPCRDEHGDPALLYRLAHAETGDTLEGTMPLLLTKSDPQGMGSALTYARRYSLCAVLNLVADEDDDGNAGSEGSEGNGSTPARAGGSKPSAPQKQTIQRLTGQKDVKKSQLAQMVGEITLTENVDIDEGWMDKYLTGGKQGTASALIDRLIKGPIPEAPATPVPESDTGDGAEFVHQAQPGGDEPWTPERHFDQIDTDADPQGGAAASRAA